jgi:endoglucanase
VPAPRSAVGLSVAVVATILFPPARATAGPPEKTLYCCDFEEDTGVFRLEASGPGFVAEVARDTAHGGGQSVKLVDPGGEDVPLVWMHEWENWKRKPNRAFLHWARHLTPQRPVPVRKDMAYEVRAFVKLEDAQGVGIAIGVWGKTGSPVRGHTERYSPIVKGTCDWRWISARVACTSGDGELASITIAPLGKGTVWVDDVQVVEYEQKEAESINAGRYPPLRLEEVRLESASCLALEFLGDLQYFRAEEPDNWLVRSDEDAQFKAGIQPVKIGRTKQLDNPDGTLWWNDTYRHTVFLMLPRPLTSGNSYRIIMSNVGSQREVFQVAFDERASLSRSIKVNQYGYVPGAKKYAYLGAWLGSAGHLPLEGTVKEFLVVDRRTGRIALRGTPTLRMRHDRKETLSTSTSGNLTGEDVYQLDLTPLDAAGEYFVVVPGVGRSLNFRIAGDVYREPFYLCARGIFHQRCGSEMRQPPAAYGRKPCHRSPAEEIRATIVEHGSEDQDMLVAENPAVKTGRTLDAWGGYHDAADFDRLIGHIRIPAVLLTLCEMSPQAFNDGQLNLPESGNGIPDLVDEARWGVDFWLRMQDADGGVRGGAGPNAAVTATPDRDEHPIYLYGKDPVASLSLAAVAAQLSRTLDSLGHKQEAAVYLERAEKAWTYGLAHGGEKFRIAHALAALELYRATGNPAYHAAFVELKPAEFDPLAQELHSGHFAWNLWTSYCQCRLPEVDETLQQACRDRIVAVAEREIRSMESFAYRMPHSGVGGPPVRYGWGCGTNFFGGGDFCVMAWRLTGQRRFRDAALLAADFSLGCHPTGTVFITGVGQRHVRWAMHPYSNPMAKNIGAATEETLPGIPIFGIHGYPRDFGGWQSQLLYVYANPSTGRDNFFPPSREWPDLRLFADIGWVPILSEFSVASTMLHSTFLYGALLAAEE